MLVVGVDESGTGAWAGPFHVGAVACDVLTFNRNVGRDLRDSKKLSDDKRRRLAPLIRQHAVAFAVVEVPVWEINLGPKTAWRGAISKALAEVEKTIGKDPYNLIIDGPEDPKAVWLLKARHRLLKFEPDADDKYPPVMAAAILAKTARNDAMVALDPQFPEYLWAKNSGYGTPEHLAACKQHGVTLHHRRIRRLRDCKGYAPKGEWFDA